MYNGNRLIEDSPEILSIEIGLAFKKNSFEDKILTQIQLLVNITLHNHHP